MAAFIDGLKNAGLTEYEGKAYQTLLLQGDQLSREVAENSGVPVTRVFDVLERLREKGLVVLVTPHPFLWRAVEPEIGIRKFIRAKLVLYGQLEKSLIADAKRLKKTKRQKG